jgi:flagellin
MTTIDSISGKTSGYTVNGKNFAKTNSTGARQEYACMTAKAAQIQMVKGYDSGVISSPTVDNYAKANATITMVQNAINNVSSQRSALGALQNRLEHTIANLDNVAENTQSAESRIRDTDMADEMVEYSKNNILAQAGQAMLAQANQATQGVLSLLQ